MRSLSKAATFHIPPSPPSDDAPFLSIPHLPQRSSTAPKSLLALMLGKENEAVESIIDFERQFKGTRPSSPPTLSDKRSGHPLSGHRQNAVGVAPVNVDLKKSPSPSHEHLSDSGLGTSISSTSSRRRRSDGVDVESAADRLLLMGIASNVSTSEIDSTSAKSALADEIQGSAIHSTDRQRSIHWRESSQPIVPSALTHSISPSHITTRNRRASSSSLSSFARQKIAELVFQPILDEDSFRFFHPLVHSLEDQTRQTTIKCLRDLEKSLIFEPLRITKSPRLYRRFGEFSIQLVLDTYLHLSESEQIRPSDRPYDNGYFLDLVQQMGRLAAQIGSNRQNDSEDETAPTVDDRITLEGGLGSTGEVAELVRWVDGKPYSLRTNKLYEPTAVMKRSASIMDEDVERSMARRKKGEIPQEMSCSDPTCDKVFTRKCDLAKHEKTHTRPFKCPEPTCKYHAQGLPTEKERDRHINDKHSKNPHFYHCQFCPFKTKRDSNCKQHMEKKHGWQYDRVKGNGKAKAMETPMATPQPTPQTPSASTPISVDYSSVQESSTRANSAMPTPIEQSLDNQPYHFESSTPVHLGGSLFNNGNRMMSPNTTNMYNTIPTQPFVAGTPYSAISAITEQSMGMNTADLDMYEDVDQDFGMPLYDHGAAMATPFTPGYEMPKDVYNPVTLQMPMTPSTASGHHDGSRNQSVSSTTPPNNPGLTQTISPQLPMEDDFMRFTAPSMTNSQFGFDGMGHMNMSDIPMDDFNLFGTDNNMVDLGNTEIDPFDAYIDPHEAYEA